jgi:hypothetical protein
MNPEEQARIDAANQASQASQALNAPNEPTNEAPPQAPEQPAEPQEPAPEAAPEPSQVTPEATPQPAPQEPAPQPEEEDDDLDPIPSFNIPHQPEPPVAPQQTPTPQNQSQVQPVPQLNPQDFADDYGNVDMAKFSQAMQARDAALAQQVAQSVSQNVLQQTTQLNLAMRQEERLWKKAEEAYPDLNGNKELRDMVHNLRVNYVERGSKMTPKQAADKIFKYVKGAKEQATQDATQTVRVQASAHLESAGNTASQETLQTRDNISQIGHHDRRTARNARENTLKDWIKSGKIQLPS